MRAANGTGRIRQDGYHDIRVGGGVRIMTHIIVAQKALGRALRGTEEIHHVNEIRSDNRNENLVICPGRQYHKLLHTRTKALAACGNANWKACIHCKTYDAPENMSYNRTAYRHKSCHAEYKRQYKLTKSTGASL